MQARTLSPCCSPNSFSPAANCLIWVSSSLHKGKHVWLQCAVQNWWQWLVQLHDVVQGGHLYVCLVAGM